MLRTVKIMALVAMFFVALSSSAQVTASALSGVVTDENQQAMIGATITALHTPSGTKYNAVTNIDGRYTIQGIHSVGPCVISNVTEEFQSLVHPDDGNASMIPEHYGGFTALVLLFIFLIMALLKNKNIKIKLTGKGLGFLLEIFSKKEDKE